MAETNAQLVEVITAHTPERTMAETAIAQTPGTGVWNGFSFDGFAGEEIQRNNIDKIEKARDPNSEMTSQETLNREK